MSRPSVRGNTTAGHRQILILIEYSLFEICNKFTIIIVKKYCGNSHDKTSANCNDISHGEWYRSKLHFCDSICQKLSKPTPPKFWSSHTQPAYSTSSNEIKSTIKIYIYIILITAGGKGLFNWTTDKDRHWQVINMSLTTAIKYNII